MNLEDVIEEAFTVKSDDSLTNVAARMSKEKKYEAFVFEGGFKGIITLDDLVKRRVNEPQKTKVSHFVRPINPFPSDTSVEDVINYMLVSEYRTIPVEKDGKIYSVSKPKLLKFVKDEVFEGKKAEDIMQFPYCASNGDTISTVISIMKEIGINRMPIFNDKCRFMGLVDGLSLAGLLIDEHTSKRGERFGDKMKLGDAGIDRFVRKDTIRVSPETTLKYIVRKISGEGVWTVIVEKEDKFLGMITIKDLFKLIGKSLETVYVRITGLSEEDDFIKSKIDEMVENTISKLLKFLTVSYVAIHVETSKREGRRMKYSVKGRFVTEKGSFYADDHEWDPAKAIKMFLEKIEREVHKRVGKERGR